MKPLNYDSRKKGSMSDWFEEIRYKSMEGIMVKPPLQFVHIGDLSRFGDIDFKDLPKDVYPSNKCGGWGAQSYTRKEDCFECDYCGNKYGKK